MKIVSLGGGSGQRQVAKAFNYLSKEKLFEKIKKVSFIVAVSDNGGSTKEIRIGEKTYAPGDIRNVASALFDETNDEIFNIRVKTGKEEINHAAGNFMIEALKKYYSNDWEKINEWLKTFYVSEKFSVYPSTLENIDLVAFFPDGKIVIGEEQIDNYIIKGKTHLEPYKIAFQDRETKEIKEIRTYELALENIKEADLIILSPGSFYTSLMPILAQKEISNVLKSKKDKVYFVNVFNYGNIAYQLDLLKDYVGNFKAAYNTKILDNKEILSEYEEEGKRNNTET